MFIGLDLGTSAVKAVAFRDHAVVASATAALEVVSPKPGWSEQDPAAWIAACREVLRELCAHLGSAASDILGIGLSGQMHGAVFLGADRKPLRNCILWNDSRSAAECAELSRRAPSIAQTAGIPPLPGFTAPKIMWLKRHEPEVYAALRHILLPKDYVGLWLHGGLETDRSDAAGTLWLDQEAGAWDVGLCSASDCDIAWLPPVHAGTEEVGAVRSTAAEQTGLPAGIPVFAGGGDAATGAVSVGATQPGRGFISLGTSGQLFLCTDQHRPNPDKYVHAFAHTLPDGFYQMAAMLNGARPLAWLAGILGCSVKDLVEEAVRASPARAPLCLPYLTGERSPHGDPDIRGAFYGLEDTAGRAELAYAVLEAVAFSMADATESFGDSLDDAPHLLAIGGGTRSDALLQLIADVTRRTLGRGKSAEAGPSVGAALLAAAGAGAIELTDLARSPDVETWFEPSDPSPEIFERLDRYRELYRCLKQMPASSAAASASRAKPTMPAARRT
ncbi:Xylulose kinase [Defluviimonas aquaemixtae]|uniref:Xylulose kinase n=1 Tax=Albidovulum aquaemixtae TaxID=1542388 RepID=A0A2R8BLJ9_9RHOB|nr:xylulokinase [Defluviimonas aquaemixtae]SPH24268.1 Xylulose kinase [Defluviimonas aquaemixtae]